MREIGGVTEASISHKKWSLLRVHAPIIEAVGRMIYPS